MSKTVNPFIGEKATVYSGPLQGHTGTVVNIMPPDRVDVELDLFGRYQRVQLCREVLLDEFGRPIPQVFMEEERKERIAEYKRLEEALGENKLQDCMKRMGIDREERERLKNGEERVQRYFQEDVCESLGVGLKWLIFGDEKWKEHPCGPQMKEYLEDHPERREQVWKWIQEDGCELWDVIGDDDEFEEEFEEEYEDFDELSDFDDDFGDGDEG